MLAYDYYADVKNKLSIGNIYHTTGVYVINTPPVFIRNETTVPETGLCR